MPRDGAWLAVAVDLRGDDAYSAHNSKPKTPDCDPNPIGSCIHQVSRDGAWLAFAVDLRGDEAYSVYVQQAAGGARTAVTLPGTAAAATLAWAADNATLFFLTKVRWRAPI